MKHMGGVGDLHSICNFFFGRWSHMRWILLTNREKWHAEPSRIRLDSLAEGDVNHWLKQIVQPGERSSVTSPAAPWSRHGTHLEHRAAWGASLLGFFYCKRHVISQEQPTLKRVFAPTPTSPTSDAPAAWSFFGWRFWRSVISSAEEKTETLFRTQLQRGRLGVQILPSHWKHDECSVLLLFFLF